MPQPETFTHATQESIAARVDRVCMPTIYTFTMDDTPHRLVVEGQDFAFERLAGSDAAGHDRWVGTGSVKLCLRALLRDHEIVPRTPIGAATCLAPARSAKR